jgi:hypothetical protein
LRQNWPGLQVAPHAPQLRGSFSRFTHAPKHRNVPVGQTSVWETGTSSAGAQLSVVTTSAASIVSVASVVASMLTSATSIPASLAAGTRHAGSANTPGAAAKQSTTPQNQWPSLQVQLAANIVNRSRPHCVQLDAIWQTVLSVVQLSPL